MSFLRGSILVSTAEYVGIAATIAQGMLISRALGPDGNGQLDLLRRTLLFGAQLASLGLPAAAVYAINNEKRDPVAVISTGLWTCLAASGAAILVLLGVLQFSGETFGTLTAPMLAVSLLYVPTILVRQIFNQYSLARLDTRALMAVRAGPESVLALLLVPLFVLGALTVERAMLLSYAVLLGGMMTAYLFVRRRLHVRPRVDLSYLRRAVPMGLQISASDMLFLLNSYVALLLLRVFGYELAEVGYASKGIAVALLAVTGAGGFLQLLYSRWSGLTGPQRLRHVERTVSLVFVGTLAGCVTVLALARYVVLVLFGHQFLPAVGVTRIMVLGVAAYMLARVLLSLFLADGRIGYNILVLAIGVAVNTIMGVVLVPSWGKMGTATAGLLGYVAMGVVALLVARQRYDLSLRRALVPTPQALREVWAALWRRRPETPTAPLSETDPCGKSLAKTTKP